MTNYSILTSAGGGGGGSPSVGPNTRGGGGGGKRGIPAFVAQITSRGGGGGGGGGGGRGIPAFVALITSRGGGGVTPCVGPNTPNDAYMGSIWVNKFQFGCEFIVREFEYFPA